MIPTGARVLDVGTDHALLPVALLERRIAERVVASDVRPGPLRQAERNRDAAGIGPERLELRLGGGFSVVSTGEVGVAVLAGMGGQLILRLLGGAAPVPAGLKRLVLAPNNHAADVRRWAAERGWGFAAEDMVADESHLYAIMALVPPGDESAILRPGAGLSEAEAELGPLLLRQAHPLVPLAAERLLGRARDALAELRRAGGGARARRREEALRRSVETLEEVLRCWPKWPT